MEQNRVNDSNDTSATSTADCVWRMERAIAQSLHRDCHRTCLETISQHDFENEEVSEFLSAMFEGDFGRVLTSSVSQQILGSSSPDSQHSIAEMISRNLLQYVDKVEHHEENIERQFLIACIGISSLQLFVQYNWTGPAASLKMDEVLSDNFRTPKDELTNQSKSALTPEGCVIYPLVRMPELLLIAKSILVDFSKNISMCKTADWWRLRCLWIQQQLLDERSPHIYNLAMPLMDSIKENEILMSPEKDATLPLTFYLECSHIYSYFYEYSKAQESLAAAKKLAGLEVDLTGALGKRTRFQEDDKAQLVLKVTRENMADGQNHSEARPRVAPEHLPKDLQLDDDTVLNSIKFREESEGEVPSLTSLEQALVLAICMDHKRSKPKDLLLSEELMSYVVGVLRHPQCWAVQMLALRVRCQLEKSKKRTVERAMMQMQGLVDQIASDSCPVLNRFEVFYAIGLPPKWTLEGELAELLTSLGCLSAALEIYVRLELWEDVVGCYKLLRKPAKAIHIIKEQLAIKESALMWCLFGDVTQEKKYYEKAWEVSGQKSSRAMNALGLLYLNDEEYEKTIECLETSLELNFLQCGAWFNLGYAAFQCEKYDTACKAYHRCVLLEQDDSQSWNNLATAYIKLNQKPKAFRTLQEALKCNYESWKIWDNLLGVSMDVGEFGESIKAYGRLLELKGKHVDEAVLGIMVRALDEDLKDSKGHPVRILRPKIVELFEKITSEVTNNATVWSLYARLLGSCATDNAIKNDKALQCLQRAHRIVTQDQRWHTEVSSVQDVIYQSHTLAEAYEKCSAEKTNSSQAIQLLSSAKLMLKSAVAQIKKEHYDPVVPPATWAELSEPVGGLEAKLEEIISRIADLKASR